jgi:myo-inositol-1(or 4)-monophosphatase
MQDLTGDHAVLCDAVREAGEVVLSRFRDRTVRTWQKADKSLITEADLQANEILRWRLMSGGRRDYGWLSEESADDSRRLDADRTWIVDPIDGTRAFVKGRPEFAVCGALAHETQVVSAAVFNPVTDEFFEATLGGGARCNGTPISASGCRTLHRCRVLGFEHMFSHNSWPEAWPQMDVAYRNSTTYRMALVAKGAFDAAIALVPKADWDVAPGALLLHEAGACASDHLGEPFRFNQPDPVQRGLVCATQGLYPDIISRLAHLPADLRQIRL